MLAKKKLENKGERRPLLNCLLVRFIDRKPELVTHQPSVPDHTYTKAFDAPGRLLFNRPNWERIDWLGGRTDSESMRETIN
jgi:hypothetical protein